ncbi:MAG: hypothetical protein A3F84_08820 [Candidatus Handelsmanbacteria bacterium RIFCSPLOWO2_12_FULL_64_10]|uniref:Protein kinase domain-containing protein n=1 Tax=Handelsmanbacteria sp. (strain RIFCSPLOWO2_12_FULL_64_10) TaxID=1817868 RepID=A0A1F6CAK1_HANXR|nr:MAG: hypothetical protein A3F84_08820 [Candidatus Handelsmanbacteria bacterium RIFCSPLOWO2_12_FULL_64_10]
MPSTSYPAVDEEALLGQLLVKHGLITHDQLVEALRVMGARRAAKLGDVLIELGYVQPVQQARRPAFDDLPCPFGKFELREHLGRGGMGRVYRAWQNDLRRTVAVKLVEVSRGESTRGLTDRERLDLLTEARAAGRLAHPNIVQVYEVGRIDGEDYISLEYVDGVSLSEYLAFVWLTPAYGRRFVRRRMRSLLMHLSELGAALEYAHSVGVMHRDIKPANILARFDDAVVEEQAPPEIKRLKLADFGLAIDLDQESVVGEERQIIGTPGYMSPEQARGKGSRWMPASDIFSLGVVAYELLTGVSPFMRETNDASLAAVREEMPKPPSKRNPDLDSRIDAIVLGCLGKDPWDRFPRASSLVEAIVAYLQGEPAAAQAPRRIARRSAGDDDAGVFAHRARARRESGDLGGALSDYTRVLDARPDDVEARVGRGLVLFALGDALGAVEDWTRAVDLDADAPDPYVYRALALRSLHCDAEAAVDYESALIVAPSDWARRKSVAKAMEKLKCRR